MFICCINILFLFSFFLSFCFSFLCCNRQQAMEDLLEDEDEEFDRDDKVIMSCLGFTRGCARTHVHVHTYTHVHSHCLGRGRHCSIHRKHKRKKEMTPSSRPVSSPVQVFSLPEAQTHVQRLYNLLTSWKVFTVDIYTTHFSSFRLWGLLCSATAVLPQYPHF